MNFKQEIFFLIEGGGFPEGLETPPGYALVKEHFITVHHFALFVRMYMNFKSSKITVIAFTNFQRILCNKGVYINFIMPMGTEVMMGAKLFLHHITRLHTS